MDEGMNEYISKLSVNPFPISNFILFYFLGNSMLDAGDRMTNISNFNSSSILSCSKFNMELIYSSNFFMVSCKKCLHPRTWFITRNIFWLCGYICIVMYSVTDNSRQKLFEKSVSSKGERPLNSPACLLCYFSFSDSFSVFKERTRALCSQSDNYPVNF